MACVTKLECGAVSAQLRHNSRTVENPKNIDIDPKRSDQNYSTLPPRSISDYDYFLQRKAELYCYSRKDLKVAASWVVTAPMELPVDQERRFFEETTEFLKNRYGAENAIQAVVHKDEGGRPHLHYVFIPVVPDLKHGGEKICANNVIDPKELRSFHPALQKHLTDAGIDCKVLTGITQEIGGSVSVRDLKRAERLVERRRGVQW